MYITIQEAAKLLGITVNELEGLIDSSGMSISVINNCRNLSIIDINELNEIENKRLAALEELSRVDQELGLFDK